MAQTAKAQEPSMEDILASIRRIIADDETQSPAPRAAEAAGAGQASRPLPAAVAPHPVPPPKASPSPVAAEIDSLIAVADSTPAPADVLDLTESMAAPEPTRNPPVFRTVESRSDVVFAEPSAGHGRDAAKAAERLLSESTSAAVDSAFASLSQKVMVQDTRTIEELVREMLRPMLKSWLDDNLPGLVERLVRAEIERVSRGHG
jgi:cell pole-organizing protein PopZ